MDFPDYSDFPPLHDEAPADMPENFRDAALRNAFLDEADACIDTLESAMRAWSRNLRDVEALHEARRAAHTLKGAAALMGVDSLSTPSADLEHLFDIAETFVDSWAEEASRVAELALSLVGPYRIACGSCRALNFPAADQESALMRRRVRARYGAYFPDAAADAAPLPESTEATAAPVSQLSPADDSDTVFDLAGTPATPGANDLTIPADEFPGDELTIPGEAEETALTIPADDSDDELTIPADETAAPAAASTADAASFAHTVDTPAEAEILAFFIQEADENLQIIETNLLRWEKDFSDTEAAGEIYRMAHSTKGAANSMGLVRIGRIMHSVEELFERAKTGRVEGDPRRWFDLTFRVIDVVRALGAELKTGRHLPANETAAAALHADLLAFLEAPVAVAHSRSHSVAAQPASAPAEVAPEAAEPETRADRAESAATSVVRIESERLDHLMNLIGELVISRSRIDRKIAEFGRLRDELNRSRSRLEGTLREFQDRFAYTGRNAARPAVDAARPDGFSDLEFDRYDDLNILTRSLMEIGADSALAINSINKHFHAFGEEADEISRVTSRLQGEITRVRMVPLKVTLQRLQRAVRDAAGKLGKSVDFRPVGGDVRVDKLVGEKAWTPLLHLVRNAVAHGVESADARRRAGKPEQGLVSVIARQEASQVVIEVADDGAGLDYARIREVGIRRGLLRPDAQVTEAELAELIFQPGFSTKAAVDEVSGRGVGLDAVREEISRINGTVQLRSEPGRGCTFIIRLPLTLAINQALFFRVDGETYAIPLAFIERVTITGQGATEELGDKRVARDEKGIPVPVVPLARALGIAENESTGAVLMFCRYGDQRIVLPVDVILHKGDIVVKPLGRLLEGHPLFSGATVAGDGAVVLILDLGALAGRRVVTPANHGALAAAGTAQESRKRRVLVVDDSLSVRKVCENHLREAGYEVDTAKDGLDGLEHMRRNPPDLVFTDLEMPRLNGFEMLGEMRRDPALAAIPAIFITSRDAEKHRARARELGAGGYIIKPFTKEDLLAKARDMIAGNAVTV